MREIGLSGRDDGGWRSVPVAGRGGRALVPLASEGPVRSIGWRMWPS
jgi:hypothetical protein